MRVKKEVGETPQESSEESVDAPQSDKAPEPAEELPDPGTGFGVNSKFTPPDERRG